MPRGYWSPIQWQVEAIYDETEDPIPGFGVHFFAEEEDWFRFSFSKDFANSSLTIDSITDSQGVAYCDVWIDEQCEVKESPFYYLLRAQGSLDNLCFSDWKINPYVNKPPGPIDVAPITTSLVNVERKMQPEQFGPIVLIGDWLAIGKAGLGAPESGGTKGLVQLHKWEPSTASWRQLYSIAAPSELPSNAGFGVIMTACGKKLAVMSSTKVYFYELNEDGETWSAIMAPATLPSGDWTTMAFFGDWIAIGDPQFEGGLLQGQAKILHWSGTNWSVTQTLNGEADWSRFGHVLAFSPDGQRLAVGAPTDTSWYLDEERQQSCEYVDIYDYVPIYDIVGYDEYNEPIYDIVGYDYVYVSTEWQCTPLPPPPEPSVYVYVLDNNEWEQEAQLTEYEPNVFRSFGTSLVFGQDWLVIGAPYDEDVESGGYEDSEVLGMVYGFVLDESDWIEASYATRGNPRFGSFLIGNDTTLYTATPRVDTIFDVNWIVLPGFISVIKWDTDHFVDLQEIDGEVLTPLGGTADDYTFFFHTSRYYPQDVVLDEYQWLPSVNWGVVDDQSIAELSTYDPNLQESDLEETESVSIALEHISNRWEISSSEPWTLSVHSAQEIERIAPSIDWFNVKATDFAGSSYFETLRVRVLAAPPGTPTEPIVSPLAPNILRCVWEAADERATSFSLERLSFEDYELAVQYNTVDEDFVEIVRLGGDARSFDDDLGSHGEDGFVYRVKARNDEGVSDPTDVTQFEFDADEDGLPDWWEEFYGGDLSSGADLDSDGWTNAQEFANGTNPLLADSDLDGVEDDVDWSAQDRNWSYGGLVLHTELTVIY